MRIPSIAILLLLAGADAAPAASLPNGFDTAAWGITAAELQKLSDVVRADASGDFGYAEHGEEDPEVYAGMTPSHERVEYYFFQGRLYKIFIIYDRIYFHTRLYEELVKRLKTDYGTPKQVYEENVFGLTVQHTVWEDSSTKLDLRKGAGFIYQVRIDTAAELRKKTTQRRKGAL
ncbi:MAG TPA: hypothetical protein VI702_03020 [Nitrospiria bacterium]